MDDGNVRHTPSEADDGRRSSARVVLSGWLAVAAVLAYLCRNSIAVAEKTIRSDLEISEETMGLIMGPAFFWTYALFQIPGGLLGQRFGSRRCLSVFNAFSSIGTAAVGVATGGATLLLGRVSIGFAQAGLFPCSTISISRWFPRVERGLASAVLGSAMSIGGAIGAALTGELLGIMDWRAIFVVYALPGFFWSAGFYWWFRDLPDDHSSVNSAELEWIRGEHQAPSHANADASSQAEDDSNGSATAAPAPQTPAARASVPPKSWQSRLLKDLASLSLWCLCLQQFFRAAGYAFFSSWFATYLQETRDVSTQKSGWLLTLPLLATVIASLIGGGLSDRILRRTGSLRLARAGLATGALVVCAALIFGSYFVQAPGTATIVISAGAFFAAFAGPCSYAASIDIGGRRVATIFGAMNMVGNFGAGLLPWVAPRFRKWVAETPHLLELSGGRDGWNAVLLLFASMYVLAALHWWIMPLRENELEDS